jgi:hypothetical protein
MKPLEAAASLRVGKSKFYEAMAAGLVPVVIVCGMRRIPRRWIELKIREAMSAAENADA